MEFSHQFIALSREASIAAEMIASGATYLGKANYAQTGYYSQAFFSLSIGIERTAKLIIMVDSYYKNKQFPTDKEFKDTYGHKLKKLIEKVNKIADAYSKPKVPDSEIHRDIITFLHNFAESARYYNLDVLSKENPNTKADPIAHWGNVIGKKILQKHLTKSIKNKIETNSALIDAMMGENCLVIGTSESGKLLNDICSASSNHGYAQFVNRYGKRYILQIARSFAEIISSLTNKGYELHCENVPVLNEFFYTFKMDDTYLLRRKTWSIYEP